MAYEMTDDEQIQSDFYMKPNESGFCMGASEGMPCMRQCLECFRTDWHRKKAEPIQEPLTAVQGEEEGK